MSLKLKYSVTLGIVLLLLSGFGVFYSFFEINPVGQKFIGSSGAIRYGSTCPYHTEFQTTVSESTFHHTVTVFASEADYYGKDESCKSLSIRSNRTLEGVGVFVRRDKKESPITLGHSIKEQKHGDFLNSYLNIPLKKLEQKYPVNDFPDIVIKFQTRSDIYDLGNGVNGVRFYYRFANDETVYNQPARAIINLPLGTYALQSSTPPDGAEENGALFYRVDNERYTKDQIPGGKRFTGTRVTIHYLNKTRNIVLNIIQIISSVLFGVSISILFECLLSAELLRLLGIEREKNKLIPSGAAESAQQVHPPDAPKARAGDT